MGTVYVNNNIEKRSSGGVLLLQYIVGHVSTVFGRQLFCATFGMVNLCANNGRLIC